jgi:hypothetical protein
MLITAQIYDEGSSLQVWDIAVKISDLTNNWHISVHVDYSTNLYEGSSLQVWNIAMKISDLTDNWHISVHVD